MLKRTGYVLIELIIVCVLMVSLTCCIVLPKVTSDEWRQFEFDFNQSFYEMHQNAQLKQHSILILASKNVIKINDLEITLPANWYVVYPVWLKLTYRSTHGGQINFVNKKAGTKRRLVFQLGGGTYDWR